MNSFAKLPASERLPYFMEAAAPMKLPPGIDRKGYLVEFDQLFHVDLGLAI